MNIFVKVLFQRAVFVKTTTTCSNHGQGTHRTKMGTVVWPKYRKNAPTFFGPICLPNPKSLGFSLWMSVCDYVYRTRAIITCSLYSFYLIFEFKKCLFKDLFKILSLCTVSIQEQFIIK